MVEPHQGTQAALAELRRSRERVTPARIAVLEVLDGASGHLTAEEIADLVTARAPGVHRATVYRALSRLGELELVTHTHVAGSAAVYHLSSDRLVPAHAHLQCTSCGTILDLPAPALQPLAVQLLGDLDFQLQPEHTALLGTCASCRRASTTSAGTTPIGP